ncbi:phage baseplate assembly protein V [Salmonella enterica]|nr:phage baseplate assembly protein V [Salmonella enterica]
MRLITNLIRTGTVTEVDRKNWLCRVKVTEVLAWRYKAIQRSGASDE